MDNKIKNILLQCAEKYETHDFIGDDPVQFPHRYTDHKDIEISGLLTAIMSFGNRKQIIKKANILHKEMGSSPYRYVMSREWEKTFRADDKSSFYRMLSHADFNSYFRTLYDVYTNYENLEQSLLSQDFGTPMDRLCKLMNVSNKSPQKKLNMFLRWMIRQNSLVDFGIWKQFKASELIIPMDVHVCNVSYLLGLTSTQTFSLSNAKRITQALNEIFPDDPCKGDFALFGIGVNKDDIVVNL